MVKLQTCLECDRHTFVVVSGEWNVWGEKQLRNPVTMLCTNCGSQLFTATWHGDENDDVPEDLESENTEEEN